VYVAKADGTIVIVTTNASTAVQVAAPGTLGDLTAGQSVTVQGATQADGTLAASEIVGTTTG
jgi:cytochrome c-type biogenesis protein CcmE